MPPPQKPSASTASIRTQPDNHGTRRSPGSAVALGTLRRVLWPGWFPCGELDDQDQSCDPRVLRNDRSRPDLDGH